MKKIQPVYIEWVDSCTTEGWRHPEKTRGISLIVSVGILVNRTDKETTITSSKSTTTNVLDQLSIPTSAIRKYKKLKI